MDEQDSTLRQEELALLSSGLPDLSELSTTMLVPFEVGELKAASVSWTNERWFLERGLDMTDTGVAARVNRWLIQEFAYVRMAGEVCNDDLTAKRKLAHADRYGSTSGLAPHGGSGRTAVYGRFQAKGVGPTPLVGEAAPPDHSNGCASLVEGLREAIYSEVMAAEFPHGAVPIIALIDTGLHFTAPARDGGGERQYRRCIIVRPSVLRPAHVERAPLFKRGRDGYANDQEDDVARVRDAVVHWEVESGSNRCISPASMLVRVAEQAAFGQVHRLFSGGCFSSNLSIAGELHDFGNAHVLPDWWRSRVLDSDLGFGTEIEHVRLIAHSMAFSLRKFGTGEEFEAEAVARLATSRYEQAFDHECLRLFAIEEVADGAAIANVLGALKSFFGEQQKRTRRLRHGIPDRQTGSGVADSWLDPKRDAGGEGTDAATRTMAVIRREIVRLAGEAGYENLAWRSAMAAVRFLVPRSELDRARVLAEVDELVNGLSRAGDFGARIVGDYIAKKVSSGRRHWKRMPANVAVLAHASRSGSSVLLCRATRSAADFLWIEGVRIANRTNFFGTWVGDDVLSGHDVQDRGCYRAVSLPVGAQGARPCIAGVGIDIPELLMVA